MSFLVTRRTREIGIRLARSFRRPARPALDCGAAFGKLIQSQLLGVTATDLETVATAAMLLGRWRPRGSIHPGMAASFEREPHGRASAEIEQIAHLKTGLPRGRGIDY